MTWIDLAKAFNVRMYGRGLVCCMAIQGAREREPGVREGGEGGAWMVADRSR